MKDDKNEEKLTTQEKTQINMKLINIQGMTKCMIPEIEKLIESQTILCLTETQQKLDNLTWNNNYNRYVSMRNKGAKKGGGLMILHHSDPIYDMKMEETSHQDMLTIRGQFKSLKATLILVYLSVIRGEEEKQNNQMIKKEIKKQILKSDEDEAVFLLGDFNGHTGTIGEQQQNYNGKLLMDLIMECNLTMLNGTDICTGINTWSRSDQKSTIDFVLVNNKGYQTCEWMEIDETQDV